MSTLGETRRVWHVIGPGSHRQHGAWYVYTTREAAERQAARMARAQIHAGTETLVRAGDCMAWDTRRPEWQAEASLTA
jgi:hypothetical protein